MTLREALEAATARLSAVEVSSGNARRDAELLLFGQLGLTRAELLAHPERELTGENAMLYQRSIDRRAASEPVQYILGQQEFYGRGFHVSPAVLIPRPETEHLVEAVLARLPQDQPLRVLDVGTGSGILAVTLALELPYAEVTAVDISPQALVVARRNAEALGAAARIRFEVSDLLTTVANERFDAIVSNPPYIPEADRATLHPEVRDYEPATALYAGPTGLDVYRRLIPQAQSALKPGGLLALEIGHGQREAIASLLAGWTGTTFIDDLQTIPRIALARRA